MSAESPLSPHDLRPPQPPTPAADAFEIHRAVVGDDEMEIAYVREGVGGYPLVLLHGYPETKRVWWRNIEPLAAAGYEVIVPDLRGYGDSGISETDNYELGLYSLDVHSLVHDTLGHSSVGVIAGDVGGVGGGVQQHVPGGDDLVGRRCPSRLDPAQQRVDAGDQFGDAEGLGDVVVGAAVEPAHALGLAAARGDQDDRRQRIAGTHLAADVEPVASGQHAIEHDQGRVCGEYSPGRVVPVGVQLDAVAGVRQVVLDQSPDLDLSSTTMMYRSFMPAPRSGRAARDRREVRRASSGTPRCGRRVP